MQLFFLGKWISRVALCAVFVAVCGVSGGLCAETKREPIPVFVSILPQKYFVQQIGGDRVRVGVLVGEGQKPDTVDLTHRQVAHLGQSRLFFLVGVPFEDAWLPRIQKAHPDLKVVALHAKSAPLKRQLADHHGHHENPHRWLSPVWVKSAANVILQALIEEDPSSAAYFRKNHHRFIRELVTLDKEIRDLLEPIQQRVFLTYHPAWEHFANTYGLKEIPIEMEGKEPGPRSLSEVVEQGKVNRVKAIFVQKQFSKSIVEPVARALNARVVSVDPLAENYVSNMRDVARQFVEAMKE